MNALDKLYNDEILPLICRGVSGLVYTQLSDVEDETNGLVTYDRRVIKVEEDRLRKIMLRLRESINKNAPYGKDKS